MWTAFLASCLAQAAPPADEVKTPKPPPAKLSPDLAPPVRLQAAPLLNGSAHLHPAARVDARVERQLEILAARTEIRHPDRCVGRPQHEVVPALARRVR